MIARNILVSISAVILTLGIAETALRLAGYKPGKVTEPIGMQEVDSLYSYVGFTADSFAVTHFDTTPRAAMRAYILNHNTEPLSQLYTQTHTMIEYRELASDYESVWNRTDTGTFAKYVQAILSKPAAQQTDYDSAVLDFVTCPFNEYGFRSMSFRKKSSKKRVLLLGDSFTYGYNAVNKTYSFADLLIAKGYEVYNTGLAGSDPPQYLSIAKEFIPLIKPDFVVVNFYLGNDAGTDSQAYRPFQPHHYVTNAGWLESCPQGVNLATPKEVYEIALSTCYIPLTNRMNNLYSKTCISTLIWSAINIKQHHTTLASPCCNFAERAAKFQLPEPYANSIIRQIEKVCTENGSSFVVSIIPNYIQTNVPLSKPALTYEDMAYKLEYVQDCEKLLTGQKYFEPRHFTIADYGPNDSHFNEKGHAKYADYVAGILDSVVRASTSSAPVR